MAPLNPLVSIVIPTFNRGSQVSEAVRSCLAQTHPNCEIIVVDDGSTDDTATALAVLSTEAGGTLHTIVQVNSGASAARNTGLAAARGIYVQFLDSDDVLDPRKITLQLSAMDQAPGCDLALCYGRLQNADGSARIGKGCGDQPMAYIEALCTRDVHVMQTIAPLWRRDFLLGHHLWDTAISLGDDLDFHTRCLIDAQAIAFVPEELFTVRYHRGDRLSDFSTDDRRLASLLLTRQKMFETLTARGMWTPACADNSMSYLRSLYVNYLRRMPNKDLLRLERMIFAIARPSPKSMALCIVVILRRLIGQRLVLPLIERRVVTSLKHRVAYQLSRLRPSILATSLRSLRYAASNPPEERTVLLVEPNEFHMETLPGYVSLIMAAGFRCMLLVRPRADAVGAMSRFPIEHQPTILRMDLWAIALFLRSKVVRRFELIFLNSGTIAERDGYFGGILDYVGGFPETRYGYLMIEHSVRTLRERGDLAKLNSNRLFALRPISQSALALRMLAPVEFGRVNQVSLSNPVVFVTVGRISPKYRDFTALISAIEELDAAEARPFRIVAIGETSSEVELSGLISSRIEFVGFQTFEAMYNLIESAHFFLPLLHSTVERHQTYLCGNTTGSRQLSLGFSKIGIWEKPFADAYGFTEENAIIYETDALACGMREALTLDSSVYTRRTEALALLKREIFQTSLANLNSFLANHDMNTFGSTRA